jgi:hypothetical protein
VILEPDEDDGGCWRENDVARRSDDKMDDAKGAETMLLKVKIR